MDTRALFYRIAATSLFGVFCFFGATVYASDTNGTIRADSHYAWGENMGWVNFAPSTHGVYGGLVVTDTAITGYAWSAQFGWINFSPTNSGQGVTNTAEGVLGGSAWVAGLGWLNMTGVSITASGKFVGTAGVEGSAVGRVSFDCSACSVFTDWRPAASRGGGAPVASSQGTGNGSYLPSPVRPPTPPVATASSPQPLAQADVVLSASDTLRSLGLPQAPKADSTHVESYQAPLVIKPTQTGRVVETRGAVSAAVEVPLRPTQSAITLSIDINPSVFDTSIGSKYLVGGVEFDVLARDTSGALVHHFNSPITITLAIPEPLQGQGLGVYWFDESVKSWVPVPGVTFAQSSVRFQVGHLTRFAILKERDTTIHMVAPALPASQSRNMLWLFLALFLVGYGFWHTTHSHIRRR